MNRILLAALVGVCACGAFAQTAPPAAKPAPQEEYVPKFSPKYRGGSAFQAPKASPQKPPAPTTSPAAPKSAANGLVRPTTVPPKPRTVQPLTPPKQALPPARPTTPPTPAPSSSAPPATPPAPAAPAPPAPNAPAPATPAASVPSPDPTAAPTAPPAPPNAPATEPGTATEAAKDAEPKAPGKDSETPSTKPSATAPTGKAAEFHTQYREFFVDNEFTDDMVGYWQNALSAEPDRKGELIQESAAFAAEAVAAGLTDEPIAAGTISNGLGWLEQLFSIVDEGTLASVVDAIDAAFDDEPGDVATPLDNVGNPADERLAMQTCLTLALYGDASHLKSWLKLPERTRAFIDDGQAFLFGGNALPQDHYDSLVSLFKAIPREVHQVVAVIVPEGTGMDAGTANLSTPGIVLNIYASADGISSPDEFYAETNYQPVAPVFTLEAAMQLVRAAQYVQFAARPELQQRRDLILGNAGAEPTRYLRRTVPPGAYFSQPDELLPQTAYLWFIDSAAAFEQAGGLLRFKENEAMDALLLLADVLSGGNETTLEFKTSMDGKVSGHEVPLQRMEVLPGVTFATGIGVNGELWSFGIDQTGGVTREPAPVDFQAPGNDNVPF